MRSVEDVLTPNVLMYFLKFSEKSRRIADHIGTVLATLPCGARAYKLDCFTVWADHVRANPSADSPEDPQDGAGEIGGAFSDAEVLGIARNIQVHGPKIILYYAEQRLSAFRRSVIPAVKTDHSCNLARLLRRVSVTTSFSKTGDSMVHRLLELKLAPATRALLCASERPYEDALEKLGHDAMQEYTEPLLTDRPLDVFENTNWHTDKSPEAVAFATVLLSEVLGCVIPMRTGHTICWEVEGSIPAVCFSENILGFRSGSGLFLLDPYCEYPALSLMVSVIKYGAAMGEVSCIDAQIAVETPESLPESSPLYRVLHSASA